MKNSTEPAAGTDSARPARDLAIDFARLVCLALVVVGHCMMTSPVLHPDGTVTTENTLAEQDWFEPVIWVFMVMPLFFVVGGITGARSWLRMQARGGSGFEFIQSRLLRLVRPAAALLAVMFVGLWGALLAGVDPQVVQLLASGAGMPLWFLAAYLAAQLNIPLLVGLHRRAPWLTLLGLVALVVTVDCFRGAFPTLANINMVFVWCAAQQLGFFMADGWLDRWSRSQLAGLIAASNLLMLVLVVLGLYRDNMLVNLNPPNLSLFLLGISQAAVLQLSRPLLNALANVRWIRAVMVVVGRHAMTVYLWHLPLLAAMTGLLLLTNFPQPASGSAEWWWSRPLVFIGVVLLLLPAVLLFGRLEDRPTPAMHSRGRAPGAVVTAVVVVFVPVADAAVNGLTLGLLGGGAACFVLAVLLLGRVPARGIRPLPAQPLSANVEP